MSASQNVEIETARNGLLPAQYLAETQEKKGLEDKALQAVDVLSGMYFHYNGLLGTIHTPPKPEDVQLDNASEETSHSTGEQGHVAADDMDVKKESEEQMDEETEADSVYWDSESKADFDTAASDSDAEDYFSCVSSDSDPDELV